MGRIKTTVIKRVGMKAYEKNKEKFNEDFNNNKKEIDKMIKIPSKRLRNIVAGYVTSLARREIAT